MLPGWDENSLIVNHARMHYFHLGMPGKPVLVLVHGFSDNGLCWEALAEELKNDFDMYMPDMRGHGLSERVSPGEPFDMTSDLEQFVRQLDLINPLVAGHSMGALIAFDFGARFPQVPKALILEDPPLMNRQTRQNSPQAEKPHPLAAFSDSLQSKSVAQLMQECQLEHPTWPEAIALRWCEAKKQLDPNFIRSHRFAPQDWKVSLGQITCPVLLITADPNQGGIITPSVSRQAQKVNSRVKVAHFPGIGHHIRFAVHREYLQVFRQFLEDSTTFGK